MDVQETDDRQASADLRASVLASAKRALGGQTPGTLREYSFGCDEAAKRIVLKAEVECPPTRDELDDIEAIESEIYADLMGDWEITTLLEVVPREAALHPLADGIAFIRQ